MDPKISQSFNRLLCLSLGLTAVVVQSRPHLSTTPKITWSKCPGFTNTTVIDCGQIEVPLAYFDTTHGSYHDIDLDKALQSQETITLGMARLKATGSNRLGSLIVNPGGPGGAGSDLTLGQAVHNVPLFGQALTEHYDIIGLDPRGTGMSHPVKCDPDVWNAERGNIFPKTQEQFDNLVKRNKRVGESCKKLTGPVFEHLDTVHVVYDVELVRRALNDGSLNFLGLSYGSQIASQYAEFFPGNVGRMVLDGVDNHSQSEVDTVTTEAVTFDRTLDQFFKWCAQSKACALHGKDVASLFDKLVTDANHNPIPAKACQKSGKCRPHVTGHDILFLSQSGLLFFKPTFVAQTESWVNFSKALAATLQGDARALSFPLPLAKTDTQYSELAIACQDWLHTAKSAADTSELLTMLENLAPHGRGSSQSLQAQSLCLGWPAPTSNPQHELGPRAKTAAPMLLVSSFFDPSTSIQWATGLKKQLPDGTSLVLRNGVGHTSYVLYGAASKAIERYFVTGKLPEDGTVYDS